MNLLLKVCVDNAQQTELGTYRIPADIPHDDKGFAEVGQKVVQRIDECLAEYKAWRERMDHVCDCLARDRSWDDPIKTMHSSECASWEIE